jgi:hypothetical protein
MSNVHRLRTTDRIFYVTVNLRRSVQSFDAPEYRRMIEVLEGSRARSKVARSKLITCGYRRDIADKKPHGQNNTDRGYPL